MFEPNIDPEIPAGNSKIRNIRWKNLFWWFLGHLCVSWTKARWLDHQWGVIKHVGGVLKIWVNLVRKVGRKIGRKIGRKFEIKKIQNP